MKRFLVVLLLTVFASLGWAQGDRDKVIDRVDEAGTVMNEIMAAPDKGIPEEILGSAQCIAVVPSMLKGGFIVGAAYGKVLASCFCACSSCQARICLFFLSVKAAARRARPSIIMNPALML